MDIQDKENAKQLVLERLHKRGIVTAITSKVKAEIFSILSEENVSSVQEKDSVKFNLGEGKVLSLVTEFLQHHSLTNTLKIFNAEIEWSAYNKGNRSDLERILVSHISYTAEEEEELTEDKSPLKDSTTLSVQSSSISDIKSIETAVLQPVPLPEATNTHIGDETSELKETTEETFELSEEVSVESLNDVSKVSEESN